MRYLKFMLFLIILLPFSVDAALCSNADKVRLQKLAQNVTTSYDYVEENGNVTFIITFYNLNSELYLVDSKNNKKFDYSSETLELGGFLDNATYKFEVRSANLYCDGSALYYIYINTPAYNPYYNDPICKDTDYPYCNKWQKNYLSYDELIRNVEEYKKVQVEEGQQPNEVKGVLDIIIAFYLNCYYIILPLIIILCILYIIIKRKKDNLF